METTGVVFSNFYGYYIHFHWFLDVGKQSEQCNIEVAQ